MVTSPYAKQLPCFYHFEKNINEKLRSFGIPSRASNEYVYNIFGHQVGSTKEELVDSDSVDEFNAMASLETVWNDREMSSCNIEGPKVYYYFKYYKADVV